MSLITARDFLDAKMSLIEDTMIEGGSAQYDFFYQSGKEWAKVFTGDGYLYVFIAQNSLARTGGDLQNYVMKILGDRFARLRRAQAYIDTRLDAVNSPH